MTESAFLQDLALVMSVAGLTSVLFSRLRWPKAIGCILAGILISRHTWGWSLLADESSVQTIAQLGVIFLMFTLGLEFSASRMREVRNVALPTAIFDTVVMAWIGYTVGRHCLGWETVPSLFLGAAICDSSTTLLAKVIDEMRWSERPFVRFVIGTSVCEDMICVGMIALITGVANGRGMSFGAVGVSLGGLVAFFLATLVFGLLLVPRLLAHVARHGDDETLLLTILGCCFFVTYVAYRLEFSLALGAFLVGMLGAGSDVRARLHRLADPLRSMFAAVFFVSIGLMVDLAACRAHFGEILALTAVVTAGKALNGTICPLACGERLKTAVQMGLSLAQIGEFAYLVALLYLTLSADTSSAMYQIVVGVSLLTTVMNPLLIRLSDPLGSWVESRCPARLTRLLDTYRATLHTFRTAAPRGGRNRQIIRSGLIELGIIAVLEFAVAFALSLLNGRDWSGLSVFFDTYKRYVFCLVMNVFSVAMFVPVVAVARRMGGAIAQTLVGHAQTYWRQSVGRLVQLVVLTAIVALFFLEQTMINVNLAPEELWVRVALGVLFVVLAFAGWRFFSQAGRRAVKQLSEALVTDAPQISEEEIRSFTIPPDAIRRLTIGPHSPAIGETVVTLDIRVRTGASVVSLEREGGFRGNPGPDQPFRAGDVVGVMGSSEQIAAAGRLLGAVE